MFAILVHCKSMTSLKYKHWHLFLLWYIRIILLNILVLLLKIHKIKYLSSNFIIKKSRDLFAGEKGKKLEEDITNIRKVI